MNESTLDLKAMRNAVGDLLEPLPRVYWSDFLISVSIGWTAFGLGNAHRESPAICASLVAVSIFSFYRALAFTHELVHLRSGALPGFYLIWHVLCGVPLLAPHFLYRYVHVTHHSRKYSGQSDGEYLGFGSRSKWITVAHFAFNLILPVLSAIRFLVVAPLSALSPSLRSIVVRKMSFMGLRFSFARPEPRRGRETVDWVTMEGACVVVAWSVFAAVSLGWLPLSIVVQWWITMIGILTLNSMRALGATHLYNREDQTLDLIGQVRDSVTIQSRSIMTKILCPVGTQYHALHHMMPSIPYHSLGEADARLKLLFPHASILHETTRTSLFTVWKELWRLPRSS